MAFEMFVVLGKNVYPLRQRGTFVCRAKLAVFQTCLSSLVNQRGPSRTVTNNMELLDAQIMIGQNSSNHIEEL